MKNLILSVFLILIVFGCSEDTVVPYYTFGDEARELTPYSLYGPAYERGIGVRICVGDTISNELALIVVNDVISNRLEEIKGRFKNEKIKNFTFWIFEPANFHPEYGAAQFIYNYDLETKEIDTVQKK